MDNKKKKLLMMTGGCILLLAGLFAFAIAMNSNEKKKFLSQGNKTSAVVIEKYITKTSEQQVKRIKTTSTDYNIRLTYVDINRDEITGITNDYITEAIYNGINVGDTIVVYYMDSESGLPVLEAAIKTE